MSSTTKPSSLEHPFIRNKPSTGSATSSRSAIPPQLADEVTFLDLQCYNADNEKKFAARRSCDMMMTLEKEQPPSNMVDDQLSKDGTGHIFLQPSKSLKRPAGTAAAELGGKGREKTKNSENVFVEHAHVQVKERREKVTNKNRCRNQLL
ncbi:hypothetical protein pipiens_007923 [Culex pipiens pipiens]|uniref:Uncharacterized protein n=1 Tax=Culex pipiens pipiens TaxID=38569 RepID=A0ABD1DKT5_CULPP